MSSSSSSSPSLSVIIIIIIIISIYSSNKTFLSFLNAHIYICNYIIKGCRKRGHFVKDCPKISITAPNVNYNDNHDNIYCRISDGGNNDIIYHNSKDKNDNEKKRIDICFNCGSVEHTLKNCLLPRINNVLKYATCFICKQIGHISRNCEENPNGLYPNGGYCHICYQKTHLVKDCPNRNNDDDADDNHDKNSNAGDNKNIKKINDNDANLLLNTYDKSDDFIFMNDDVNEDNTDINENDEEDDSNNHRKKKQKNKLKKRKM